MNDTAKKAKGMNSKRRAELVFYFVMVTLPLMHFIIFYIGVNFNSVLLSFKEYRYVDGKDTFIWAGLKQYKLFFNNFFHGTELPRIALNSLVYFIFGMLTGFPLSIFFSFYIYKKFFGSEFFRVMLFLPSIISSVVLVFMYKFMIDKGLVEICRLLNVTLEPPLSKPDTMMPAVLVFNTITGFGTNVLMYSSAMSRIPVSVVEYSKLEGIKPMREMVSISIPLVWPTISTFLILGISGIFTSQGVLYAMFAKSAPVEVQNFGYYLFKLTNLGYTETEFPYAAAGGIIFTLIAVPLTLSARRLFNKLDPGASF